MLDGEVQFFVDISNRGMTDIKEPFTLTFSLLVGTATHQVKLEVPSLESRSTRAFKVSFDKLPGEKLHALREIQGLTRSIAAGRLGFFLDVSLDDNSLYDDLGWTERNDRLFFTFDEEMWDVSSIRSRASDAISL